MQAKLTLNQIPPGFLKTCFLFVCLFLTFSFFLHCWGLKPGPHTYQVNNVLPLSCTPRPTYTHLNGQYGKFLSYIHYSTHTPHQKQTKTAFKELTSSREVQETRKNKRKVIFKGNLAFILRASYVQRKINKTGHQIGVETSALER